MSGYVYAIGVVGTLLVKIGRSKAPDSRLATLRTIIPFKLELLHVWPVEDATAVERALHDLLSEVRQTGEWFEVMTEELPGLFEQAFALTLERGEPPLLGERVLILRRRAGWTQQKLADACGLQVNTISRLEQGGVKDLRGQHIVSIAQALRTTPDYLLGFDLEITAEEGLNPDGTHGKGL